MKQTRVWDLPTRLFHWLLTLSIAGAVLTSFRENLLVIHVLSGTVMTILVIFRLFWGFVGGAHSRFSSFVRGPREVLRFAAQLLRGRQNFAVGHNSLAGWVAVGILAVLALTAATGLTALSGQEGVGPAAHWFDFELGRAAAEWHVFAVYGFYALFALHMAGLFLYILLRKENPIKAMITGRKVTREGGWSQPHPPAAHPALRFAALAFVPVALLLVLAGDPYQYTAPTTIAALAKITTAEGKAWEKECGSCHHAFHPSLLPEASWRIMMEGLADHFGENAGLPPEEQEYLTNFAISNSADRISTEASASILGSLEEERAPQRITETSYWKNKHKPVGEEVFKRESVGSQLNCEACHGFALFGSFEDAHIKIPEDNPAGMVSAPAPGGKTPAVNYVGQAASDG